MQNKIAFIVPYFGKFPSNFQLWLNSCAWNPSFDWLIFTDDKTEYDYPQNVKVIYTNFCNIKTLLQSRFDFVIDLPSPYKLCDFRPAYGEVFDEFLKHYDFWGYCDIDLVWGQLEQWINDTSLAGVDRVSEWGHCCLFRNVPKINTLYKENVDGVINYKHVFSSECNYLFDEVGGGQQIFKTFKVSTLQIPLFDVAANVKRFTPTCASSAFVSEYCTDIIVKVDKGKVLLCGFNKGKYFESEFAYAHFAKRNFKIEVDKFSKRYLIVPNKISSFVPITYNSLEKFQPRFGWYPSFIWKGIKGKIDVLLGKNKVKWPNSRLQKVSDFFHGKNR